MVEIPKAASSVHYNKEIKEEEKNKEKQKPKTKGRLSYSLPSGPAFSEGGNPKAPVGNHCRCGKPGHWR